ncbi:hypothetical protein KDW_63170 [Dictyobacter vulcani]|uniref:Methyltransferase type 11 domain-containing protein n=1 Tax=Dictyobacter vulcani TaxID=2607529 RepID=A0A5J4KW06_9CHLR|nr:hypothetical protein KDW_63170 [Dictyobacter vulcani]
MGCEVCRVFPEAKIYGLDLELAPRPDMPANYRLIKGDIRQRLQFSRGTFDFIHQRFVLGSVPAQEWPVIISHFLQITTPGGWIELVDTGSEPLKSMGPMTAQMMDNMAQLAPIQRNDMLSGSKMDDLLKRAGMINLHKKVVYLPVGKWGGRMGSLMATNLTAALQSFKDVSMTYFHYAPEYFDICLASAVREWDEYHLQFPVYICFAQKP